MTKKKRLGKELVVLVGEGEWLWVVRFQGRVMSNVEGQWERLGDRTVRVLMKEAYEEDTVVDIRLRIVQALTKFLSSNP